MYRIGEHVQVPKSLNDFFAKKKLPNRLQVVDVTYMEESVVVELWFDQDDIELWKDADTKSMLER